MPSSIRPLVVLLPVLLAACTGARRPDGGVPLPEASANALPGTARVVASPSDIHVPDFARRPYEPFSRADAVAIALREWRLWGQNVDDDPPGTRPPPLPEDKPERMPGLWQRVGEYWFESQDATAREGAWTGRHAEYGTEYEARRDGSYAWSAAFISYIMRIDGAGNRFPYSSVHADYINLARQQSLQGGNFWAVTAEAPYAYPPQQGDLICESRGRRRPLRFEDLPTPDIFAGHCDIVVGAVPGQLTVIGGNVDDSVTMKHVPTTPDGLVATADGVAVDGRYPWFVVLRVLYDR